MSAPARSGSSRSPVQLGDLALAFDETTAATVDVQVGGSSFFPAILDDITAATSSVHVNQYGFRPGTVGEQFANALLAKAAEGVAVRVVVDRVGSRPGRSGGFYERLRAGGVEVRVVRAPGAHRPPEALRRRRPRRLGRRRGDRGPLRRWSLPRPVRPPHGAGGRAAAARVPRQLPLARRGRPASSSTASSPSSSRARSRRRCSTTRPARTVPSRPPSRSCSTARARRSMS